MAGQPQDDVSVSPALQALVLAIPNPVFVVGLDDPCRDGSADDAPRRIANLERGVATLREVLDGNAPLALAASDPGRGC